MVLLPGRSEPIEKYAEVVGELLARGFAVLAHDWRGQGLSSRTWPHGFLPRRDAATVHLRDFGRLLEIFGQELPRPWIAVAHSMGAGLTLLALTRGESRFAAAILSAPMVLVRTLDHPPTRVRRYAGLMRIVGRGATSPLPPHVFERETFEANVLTHDAARWERTHALFAARPELRLELPTWSWLAFALDLNRSLRRRGAVERVTIPTVVVAAGDDRLCDNAATADLVRRAPRGRYVEVERAYHEILMETDEVRRSFWREFDRMTDAGVAS